MAETHPPTADWPEWRLIDGERQVLRRLTALYREREERRFATVYPLLDSIHGSLGTLAKLCSQHNIRDGYVIARVAYETIINSCFIVAGGDEVAERAWRHAHQKALRDLDRSIEIAGKKALSVRWSGADKALSDPENQRLLPEFTSRTGREITVWTPESVRERLETVIAQFGQDSTKGLVFGLLLYRHASEIAHGTLYGALFVIGGTDPRGFPMSIEELQKYRVDHARMLLMLIGFALEDLIVTLSGAIGEINLGGEATRFRTEFSERRRGVGGTSFT